MDVVITNKSRPVPCHHIHICMPQCSIFFDLINIFLVFAAKLSFLLPVHIYSNNLVLIRPYIFLD